MIWNNVKILLRRFPPQCFVKLSLPVCFISLRLLKSSQFLQHSADSQARTNRPRLRLNMPSE